MLRHEPKWYKPELYNTPSSPVPSQGKGEMSTYWLEGRDGLQLQDVNLAGTSADEDGISNPAFMHMVDNLHDSPEQKQAEKVKK